MALRMNVIKIKEIQLLFGKKSSVPKVDPCGVCGEQVGCNSIKCMKCQRRVYHCWSDVPRQVNLLLMSLSVEHILDIIAQQRGS